MDTSQQADGGDDRPTLLEIVVYEKGCRIGGTLALDDLVKNSEVGDWKMPDFKAAGA